MTDDRPTNTRYPASAQYPDAVAAFTAIGWTTQEWEDLHKLFSDGDCCNPGGAAVASWLRNPPMRFVCPVTSFMVQNLFARHGTQTARVLAGIAAGASERFCCAFFSSRQSAGNQSVVDGWLYAADLDLTEPQATGWAGTDYLGPLRFQPDLPDVLHRGGLIMAWTTRFGPDAYLYPLAGITLDEAMAMQDDGKPPTDNQLRVMVALNGHALPAGI